MTDLDVETRVRDAAPDLASLNGLAAHRARILAEARARRTRRWRMWGVSAAASLVLVGGGSVAMAGDGNETPWGWVADNVLSIERADGSACFQGLLVKWDGLTADDPMVLDAKAIVSSIDLETLDTSEKEAELRADYAQATDSSGNISPITMSDDELKQSAINQIVAENLWEGLKERGHEMWVGHEVSLSGQSTDCR
jgi:hypothetical protein